MPDTGMIAIVDDDRSIRISLERLLKSVGLKAECFASAEDYLETTNHEGICCIILDVVLPGMNGFELDRRLATEPNRLPVVFISAHDEEEMHDRAARAGAIAFLGKPFDDDAILNAVHTARALLKDRLR
jgi:FixJ family two-component response regulator